MTTLKMTHCQKNNLDLIFKFLTSIGLNSCSKMPALSHKWRRLKDATNLQHYNILTLLYMYLCLGSSRLTQAVEHTGKTYDDIGEMIAEQVCKKYDEIKPLLWLAELCK